MLNNINNILWMLASLLIFVFGIYFSFKIKFRHFNFFKMIKTLFQKSDKNSISAVETLTMNLAARIGVGSITGIALAIYLGGVGTIFWMWITSFIASSNTFLESVLAVIFRKKDEGSIYKGGPSYYIEGGLKKKKLANLYSLIIIFAFSIGFLTIQSNTITLGIVDYFKINPIIIGFILAIIVGLVIIKGIKNIAKVTNYLVPFMGILYLIICLIIIGMNFEQIPNLFISIIKDAFSFKSAGIGVFATFLIGMQKGIFSNEAGIGTGAIAAATSDTSDPKTQGYIQSFGVYIDTLIIGTLSAFVVMLSDFSSLSISDANGIEIAKYAFGLHLGNIGEILLIVVIILFAFATIISGYYYSESSLKFIKKNTTKKDLNVLKIITLLVIILGSFLSSSFLWNIVDISVAILAIINIYALYLLKDIAFNVLNVQKKSK